MKYLLIGIAIQLFAPAFCQDRKQIYLERENSWMPNYSYTIQPMENPPDEQVYRIPKNIGRHIIKCFDFNYRQYLKEMVQKKSIPLNSFQKQLLGDSTEDYPKDLRSRVSVILFDSGRQRKVILDANQNNDFTDDKIYALPLAELKNVEKTQWSKYIIREKIQIEIFSEGERKAGTPYITIYPFTSRSINILNRDTADDEFELLGLSWDVVKVGKIDELTTIYARNIFPLNEFTKLNCYFTFLKNGNYSERPYKVGDVVDIYGVKYKIGLLSPSSSVLYLEKLMEEKVYGFDENFYVQPIITKTLSGSPIQIYPKGKFLLLDFWGTWCKPCLELTNDLKLIFQKYSKVVDFVSIASDNDINAVVNYIESKELNWQHIREPSISDDGNKRPVLTYYSVGSFPTFILINPDGKIIFRNSGVSGLKQLEAQLKNISTNNIY